MTFAMGERIGISRQRGFWLRCFLGRMLILPAAVMSLCGTANANECVWKTLHVRSVHGYVVDQDGTRVLSAKIRVKHTKEVVLKGGGEKIVDRKSGDEVLVSTVDQQGAFALKLEPGEYELIVEAEGFAPARAYVQVGVGVRSLLRSDTLRMVVIPMVLCRREESAAQPLAA